MKKYTDLPFFRQITMIRGTVLPKVFPVVLAIACLSCFESWLIIFEHIPPLSMSPFTVLGVVLGLLLTFRTNASYDRFWEGRKSWGTIVNRSRDLARQIVVYQFPSDVRLRAADCLYRFSEELKHQLRGNSPAPSAILPDAAAIAVPQEALLELSAIFRDQRKSGVIDSIDFQCLDANITQLMDQIGICERIKKTPMPIGYVMQLRRFVVSYCLLLPFALAGEFSWRAPIIVSFIAFSFFGIEFIGAELEDPFRENANAIDLKSIVETIHRDVKLLLQESHRAALS